MFWPSSAQCGTALRCPYLLACSLATSVRVESCSTSGSSSPAGERGFRRLESVYERTNKVQKNLLWTWVGCGKVCTFRELHVSHDGPADEAVLDRDHVGEALGVDDGHVSELEVEVLVYRVQGAAEGQVVF